MNFANAFFFCVLLATLRFCTCELEAVLCASRLPVPAYNSRAIYDGDDFIYIFGGLNYQNYLTGIHKYQISTDTISTIADFPTPGRFGGGLTADSSGDFFYWGGRNSGYHREIFKLSSTEGNLQQIGVLDDNFYGGAFATHAEDANIAYLIGGSDISPQYIQCFNMTYMTNCGLTDLSDSNFRQGSSFTQDDTLLLFSKYAFHMFMMLNLTSLNTRYVSTNLPDFREHPSAVSDGNFGYLIGGYENSSQTPSDSLIRFDPLTFNCEFLSLKNHPGSETGKVFDGASVVYVEKLNRIYIFGGRVWFYNEYYENIWYVNLSPVGPTTQMPTMSTMSPDICEDKPNGFYPHPTDCSKYIGCKDGVAELFQCPDPLLFDPDLLVCSLPEEVDCQDD